MSDNRHPFEPLSAVQEVDESQIPQDFPRTADRAGGATSLGISSESNPSEEAYRAVSPYWSSVSSRGGAVEGSGLHEVDSMPLTSEMGMNPQIVRSTDHHPHPVAAEFMDSRGPEVRDRAGTVGSTNSESGNGDYGTYPGRRRSGSGSALWQQNRVQTRNMNWL